MILEQVPMTQWTEDEQRISNDLKIKQDEHLTLNELSRLEDKNRFYFIAHIPHSDEVYLMVMQEY